MATRRQRTTAAVQEQALNDTEQPSEDNAPSFQLEPLSDEAQMALRAWGNSTVVLVQKLAPIAPQWSELVDSFFQLVKAEVQSHS